MLKEWTISKLQELKQNRRVLVRDPLRLLPEADSAIHIFARNNGFTVIVASTNLVFRELFERAISEKEVKKILVLDRAPLRRRLEQTMTKAPPPFYPDFLSETPPENRVELDLRQFLRETTGDPNWPVETNNPLYARLIANNLESVIRAHRNLRAAHPNRFDDHDFKKIVAYAALGVAESAFKKLEAQDYWKIGLLAHEMLSELEKLTPEVTKPILAELRKAPTPFCWFAEIEPEIVIRAFYLSVILAQHTDNWSILLANIDSSLGSLSKIEPEILTDAAPKLIEVNPKKADEDLQIVEQTFDRDAIQLVLIEQLKISTPEGFTDIIEKENYSTLFRSLALLVALDDLLSANPNSQAQDKISKIIFNDDFGGKNRFVDKRISLSWSYLKDSYSLASEIQKIRQLLSGTIKTLKVLPLDKLTFKYFTDIWNKAKANRLEYFVSALARLLDSGVFLPKPENEMPLFFTGMLEGIKKKAQDITDEVHRQIDEINIRFQEMVSVKYPDWVMKDTDVLLTSHFIRRCLKPNWDPVNDKAVVFIFDGMRYDIWDEYIRPVFSDRMEVIKEYQASSLLPSETHISRKAICAGTFPDSFDTNAGENKLLKSALSSAFGYKGDVEVVSPEGTGVGETVRYRAGNLEIYIFELCDKELHKIQVKSLPDGRQVPSRPLSFIYQQHIKNIIDTEVMAIVRNLLPGTKVFVTADHGFGRVGRQHLWFNEQDLNESDDCKYLNCKLKTSIDMATLPEKVRSNIIAFSPAEIRMPIEEKRIIKKTGQLFHKEYQSIVFPKIGYSFSRQGKHYNPDAYSHGGVSIQEMMIPMIALKVKEHEEGAIVLKDIVGPVEVLEGEKVEFILNLTRIDKEADKTDEIRIDVNASYSFKLHARPLPSKVMYVSPKGTDIVYIFRPDPNDATVEERKQGAMERTLTVNVSYKEGFRLFRKSRTHNFKVRLNPDQVVRRVPANLGNILGLTPKSMR